ncbi:MAG: hypothetical protein EOP49_30005, partial [Sphingobacteriales bacterium]
VAGLPNNFVFAQTGTYTFTMVTDPNNQFAECNENNNTLVRHITVTNLPDMRILSQHIAPSKLNPEPGEPITMNVSYENIGQSNINQQMKLKLLIDNIPVDSVYPVNGLVTGGTTTVAIPASWSSSLVGIHVIRAIIDADDVVNEGNETNNEATRSFVVGSSANLFFNQFFASNNIPAPGDTIILTARIGNNGDLATEADVSFYYLNDQLDTLLIGTSAIAVPANDSITLTFPWKVINNSTVLAARITNASELEFTYDDNRATTLIGGPPQVTVVSAAACTGTDGGSMTAVVTGGKPPYTFSWSNNASSQTVNGAAGSYSVTVTDILNRTATASGVIADSNCCPPCTKAPKKPSLLISGMSSTGATNKFCPGDTIIVSVKIPDPTACSYSWTVPPGTVLLGGQGTDSIVLALDGNFAATSNIYASAINTCGTSAIGTGKLNRGAKPGTPGSITGIQDGLCDVSGVTYVIPTIGGLVYNWYFDTVNTATGAGIITSGQGTGMVTADFTSAWVKGVIHVTASNACGTSGARKMTNLKPAPGKPAGITGPSQVTAYQAGVQYSI